MEKHLTEVSLFHLPRFFPCYRYYVRKFRRYVTRLYWGNECSSILASEIVLSARLQLQTVSDVRGSRFFVEWIIVHVGHEEIGPRLRSTKETSSLFGRLCILQPAGIYERHLPFVRPRRLERVGSTELRWLLTTELSIFEGQSPFCQKPRCISGLRLTSLALCQRRERDWNKVRIIALFLWKAVSSS